MNSGRFVVSAADGEEDEEGTSLLEKNSLQSTASNGELTDTVASSAVHTPTSPPTPGFANVPRIAETPPQLETPGSVGSGSDTSSPFLPSYTITGVRDTHNTPRCSIPGGERGKFLLYAACFFF